jgi:hypothetical protein
MFTWCISGILLLPESFDRFIVELVSIVIVDHVWELTDANREEMGCQG